MISFCTVCMNRLHHLSQTLPVNLEANRDFPEVEFVLLDYNSSDGLEDYMQTNYGELIRTGRISFFRTVEHAWFRRSHSRNIAFRLAKGDIVCNIDADNYTGDS